MATECTDKDQTRPTTEVADPSVPKDASSSTRSRSASSSDDGVVSEPDGDAALANDSSGDAPPLPDEAPPNDDGWYHEWVPTANTWIFINRFTGIRQWENPRVPEANATGYGYYDSYASNTAPGTSINSGAPGTSSPPRRPHGGYNPAIHGDYDPNADYALNAEKEEEEAQKAAANANAAAAAKLLNPNDDYTTVAHFNRFTGRFQDPSVNPDNHNDANKSRRQMTAFFDVDAAANSHDGRSLKAERRGKNLSKKELKAFKDKRREKKEEKRRAWLLD